MRIAGAEICKNVENAEIGNQTQKTIFFYFYPWVKKKVLGSPGRRVNE